MGNKKKATKKSNTKGHKRVGSGISASNLVKKEECDCCATTNLHPTHCDEKTIPSLPLRIIPSQSVNTTNNTNTTSTINTINTTNNNNNNTNNGSSNSNINISATVTKTITTFSENEQSKKKFFPSRKLAKNFAQENLTRKTAIEVNSISEFLNEIIEKEKWTAQDEEKLDSAFYDGWDIYIDLVLREYQPYSIPLPTYDLWYSEQDARMNKRFQKKQEEERKEYEAEVLKTLQQRQKEALEKKMSVQAALEKQSIQSPVFIEPVVVNELVVAVDDEPVIVSLTEEEQQLELEKLTEKQNQDLDESEYQVVNCNLNKKGNGINLRDQEIAIAESMNKEPSVK